MGLALLLTLVACSSNVIPPTNFEIYSSTTLSTTMPITTANKPTGVPGSTLLPENAPEAAHFLGGGICFQCHEAPTSHAGEILNQFGCDRCHIQTSTILPETPTATISN